ncbi:hypothetical protein ACD661_04830 [Legionella lytica]|uniref:Secreted protein n=1 Tax=Legionella lytica TaxID=96232 RepID=A0ABW8D8M0_9GAMM
MLRIIFSFLTFFHLGICHAGILQCVGMLNGITVNIISDPDSKTLNVNGNILKVTGANAQNTGFRTENYINNNGVVVYYSMALDNDNKPVLIQYNGVNQDPEFYIDLACH